MADIVERLTTEANRLSGGLARHIDVFDAIWIREAATEIVTLRRQLAEAREALAQCEGALKAGGFEQGFAAEAARKWREKYPS